ncbi:hypothetical protein ACHHYP_02602 [Achlya hypogyna]|uniref:Transmembrane protein n=1 Tax=Achlya hypogyna TaxID=1202772 RepID=A0A1V9Z5T4_ACHHY|nr:hypothetical protein ACHHYP_02602 [Achlya hypogyna]
MLPSILVGGRVAPSSRPREAWSLAAPAPTKNLGHGVRLSLLSLCFAAIGAVSTYSLSHIANTPVHLGLTALAFTYNQWQVPVTTLLQGRGSFVPGNSSSLVVPASLSLSDILFRACGINDDTCAAGVLPTTNLIWTLLGTAFASIPGFADPTFQDPTVTVQFNHINNLNGFNKPAVQYFVPGHATAITCLMRRASFQMPPTARPVVDSLAFCSPRTYDPKWVCENEVAGDVPTYVFRLVHGSTSYLGAVARGVIYMNAGTPAFLVGSNTSVVLAPVPIVDEYQGGIVQDSAPWDVLPACDCSHFNAATRRGWLLQIQGVVTMTWRCTNVLVSSAFVLLGITLYLVVVQFVFLRWSIVCTVPVYLSKNIVGFTILFLAFWNNSELQTLTTYMAHNHIGDFPSGYYSLCGPAQLASIVGIMTSTLVQIWFNPRLVTQTWILGVASAFNWCIVFYLEGFVFPYASDTVPNPCGLPASTNCLLYTAIPRTYYMSAIAAGTVVAVTILAIYAHSHFVSQRVSVPKDNSVLLYMGIANFTSIATSIVGCAIVDTTGAVAIDEGLLLIKNMLHASNTVLTRRTNVQYEVFYRLLPRCLRHIFSRTAGSMLVVHIEHGRISRTSSYKYLHEMDIDHMDEVRGYLY